MIDGSIKSINGLVIINLIILRLDSQYSICEGALKINDLSDFCKRKKLKPRIIRHI